MSHMTNHTSTRLRACGLAAAGSIVVIVCVWAAVVSPALSAIVPVVLAAIWFLRAPLPHALVALIFIRSLTDWPTLPAGLSSAANGAISALVLCLLARQIVRKRKTPVGRISILLAIFLVVFTVVGLMNYGLASDLLSDTLRGLSVLAISALGAFVTREAVPNQLMRAIAVAVAPSAVLALIGFATHSPLFYNADTARAFGSYAHPVAAAAQFSLALLLSVGTLLIRPQLSTALLSMLYLFAIFATASLGGVATASIGVVILIALAQIPARIKILLAGAGSALVVIATFLPSDLVGGRITELASTNIFESVDDSGATNSASWRLRNWLALIKYWKIKPVFGWGWGSTSVRIQPLAELPHSGPVRVLVETGIVGCAVALCCLVGAYVAAARAGRTFPPLRGIVVASLVSMTVNSLTSNTLSYMPTLYVFAAAWTALVTFDPPHFERQAQHIARVGRAGRRLRGDERVPHQYSEQPVQLAQIRTRFHR